MRKFHFPLQKVLELRKSQVDIEEARYRKQTAILQELDRVRAEWQSAGSGAEIRVREWNPVAAGELEALGFYRLHVRSKEAEMAATRLECCKRLEAQHAVVVEARRRLRLLERLRERKLEQWRYEQDKALQELASESHLAKWNRESL